MGAPLNDWLMPAALAVAIALGGCAAAGSAPVIAKEALCAVHNSTQMINLCENPVRK